MAEGAHIFIKNGQSVGDAISEHANKNSSAKSKSKERTAKQVVEDYKSIGKK